MPFFQILCPWFLSEWIDGIVAFTHFLLDIHVFAHGLLLLRFQLIRAILVSECSLLISLAASQLRAKSEERLLFSNLLNGVVDGLCGFGKLTIVELDTSYLCVCFGNERIFFQHIII